MLVTSCAVFMAFSCSMTDMVSAFADGSMSVTRWPASHRCLRVCGVVVPLFLAAWVQGGGFLSGGMVGLASGFLWGVVGGGVLG